MTLVFVAIAAMAAVTERIRFLTNVVKLPIRPPVLAAKQSGIPDLRHARLTRHRDENRDQ